MKNKFLYIIVFLLFILCGYLIFFSNKETNEKYINDLDYLYDIALNYVIDEDAKEDNPDHSLNNYHFFATYKPFGITEDGDTNYVYMWILGESYSLKDETVEPGSGYSIFHRFTIKDDKVVKMEIPEDGDGYTKSLKKMCPDKKMEKLALNYDLDISNDKEVEKYYKDYKYNFSAKVLENKGNTILVKVITGDKLLKKNEKVLVSYKTTTKYGKDSILTIYYDGIVNESSPVQITAGSIILNK